MKQSVSSVHSPAEFQVLVDCINSRSARIPPDGFNWERLLRLARRHSVRPLALRGLTAVEDGGVPGDVLAGLRRFGMGNARRNAILTLELARLLAVLEKRGIRAATFKGPILAEHVHGGIEFREFVDVDIVVRQSDFSAAAEFLAEEGYGKIPSGDAGGDALRDYVSELGQIAFVRENGGYAVDLHYKLASFGAAFPFSEDEMWSGMQNLPLAGREVTTLAWDHLALYLAFHGSKERWRSLKWVCDFAALVERRPELDWADLRRRAARNHCSRDLIGAALLGQSLGFAMPPALLDVTPDPQTAALTRRTLATLNNPQPETDLSIFIYSFRNLERFRDKARLTFKLFATRTVSDFETIRLPRRLWWLYYLIRPVRIAGKALRLMLRPSRSDEPPDS